MRIFIDSANIDEIKIANEWGVVDGVTTNPTLIAKEKNKNKKRLEQQSTAAERCVHNAVFKDVIQKITDIIDGPISVEVTSVDAEGIVEEAIEISKWSKNIVIKIPVTPDGLRATRILRSENIKTNITLVFSTGQALLAAKAGATYVSIFVGRLDDIGHNGIQVVSDTVKIFNLYRLETQVIAASIRHHLHVIESAKAGANIATIPFDIIEKMFKHALTDIGVERFLKDWEMVKNG